MKADSSTNIKNNFSAYLDQVKNGQVVLVLEYGKPVAQISKPVMLEDNQLALSILERQGFISLPIKPKLNAEKFLEDRISLEDKTDLLSALIDERSSGY